MGKFDEYEKFMIIEILDSGEVIKLNITEEQFRENNGKKVLDPTKVLIIIKEDWQRIYIWKGSDSPVRKRFISSRIAQELQEEMRKEAKYHRCKIVSVDAGNEPPEFLNAFGFESMKRTKRKPDIRYVFKYNDDLNEYQKLDVGDNTQVGDLLDPDLILLFFDQKRARIWIWHGSNTTTRMKFIAAKLAPTLRDKHGIGFKILAVDEGNETLGFRIMLGLEQESSNADLNRVMKKLKEKQIPSGFERELIIIGNHVYGVVEKIQQFLGERQVTKEISKLGVIPEGEFFAKDYTPRILTEGSKILAVELLKRSGQTKDKVSEGDNDVIIYLSSKK